MRSLTYRSTSSVSEACAHDVAHWPAELRALLGDIQTIEALDVMCAVVREPFRRWRLEELPGATAADLVALLDAIRHLVGRGLLQRHGDGSLQSGLRGARTTAMHTLCMLCDEDRASVLGAIAQLSIERVRVAAARALVGHASSGIDEP